MSSISFYIYRFERVSDAEIQYFDNAYPYKEIYIEDEENINRTIKLFSCDDQMISNLTNSKLIRKFTLPTSEWDMKKLYADLGFDAVDIENGKVHMQSSNFHTISFTDGKNIKETTDSHIDQYKMKVMKDFYAIKFKQLWYSRDYYCDVDVDRVKKYFPDLEKYSYVPVSNSLLAKAEIPFLIFERNRGKCFLEISE